jgi:hypothetical protein
MRQTERKRKRKECKGINKKHTLYEDGARRKKE